MRRPPEPSRVPTAPARIGGSSSARQAASSRAVKVVAVLRDHGPLSTKQLQERLGWSRSTMRDVLASLVDQAEVVRTATSPRSPAQRYDVA